MVWIWYNFCNAPFQTSPTRCGTPATGCKNIAASNENTAASNRNIAASNRNLAASNQKHRRRHKNDLSGVCGTAFLPFHSLFIPKMAYNVSLHRALRVHSLGKSSPQSG